MTKRAKQSPVAAWSIRRTDNLDQMIAKARRDDAALFKQSSDLLDGLAQLLRTVGDDAGALYVASVAGQLSWKSQTSRCSQKDAVATNRSYDAACNAS